MSSLEASLGLRLLHRTTRSVSPTEEGKRLLETLGPALADIDAVIETLAEQGVYDVLIVDRMLPRLDGLSMIRELRSKGIRTPVLILSALGEVDDRVKGLRAGGDDYLPKPFALEELLARLRALLRRATPPEEVDGRAPEVLRFADLELDPGTREVRRGERSISLTRTEFSLLELLLAHPRRVLTRGQILEQVWGYDFPTSGNALEVYVGYLRRKTAADGEQRLIHTVRGVGYVLRESPP